MSQSPRREPPPIIVTGANGFIGRRCCARLRAQGHRIIACARAPGPGLTTVDLTDSAAFSVLVAAQQPSCIIHLASLGVAPSGAHDPALVSANLVLADTVIRAAAEAPGCRVIMTGSMAEYGIHDRPLHEHLAPEPGSSLACYGIAKLAAGIHARSLGRRLGVPVALARLFGVYGPGEAPHRLFPSLLSGLRAGQVVELSDGQQQRDFIQVDDACAVLEALIRLPFDDLLVNVGTGVPVRVSDTCRKLAAALGVDPGLLRFGARPRSPGDADLLVADTARLRSLIGEPPPARLAAEHYDLGWFIHG